jgi:hypothetical protein
MRALRALNPACGSASLLWGLPSAAFQVSSRGFAAYGVAGSIRLDSSNSSTGCACLLDETSRIGAKPLPTRASERDSFDAFRGLARLLNETERFCANLCQPGHPVGPPPDKPKGCKSADESSMTGSACQGKTAVRRRPRPSPAGAASRPPASSAGRRPPRTSSTNASAACWTGAATGREPPREGARPAGPRLFQGRDDLATIRRGGRGCPRLAAPIWPPFRHLAKSSAPQGLAPTWLAPAVDDFAKWTAFLSKSSPGPAS